MSQETYTPPKVWAWDSQSGGKWAGVNRPIAGPTHDQALPQGDAPLQLYSLGTPNGIKITVMLEELRALGKTGADYDLRVESDTLTAGVYMDGGTGDVGFGTDTPGNELHIKRPDGNIGILLESDTANQAMRMSLSDGTGAGGASWGTS